MISTQQIKELRERTGAGISEVKRALEESGGDMKRALTSIEQRLGSIAGKREGRETRAGVVDAYLHSNNKMGVLVEVFCETDFVARNPEFKALAHEIAMHIAAMAPTDSVSLFAQSFVKDESKTVRDVVQTAIGKFGENIKIERFIRFEI